MSPTAPEPLPRRRRRRALRILLVLLATLAALEVGARLAARLTDRQRGVNFHPEYGWRPAPNVQKRGRNWGADELSWTNSRGWRDAEVPLEPAPGTRRIVVLGDSYTFGVMVNYGDRFTEVLERELDATEVINLGVTAYGTDQELRVLEEEGLSYRPDVVVLIAYPENDLDDIQYARRWAWPKPHYRLEAGELLLTRPEQTLDVRLRSRFYLGEVAFQALEGFVERDALAEGWPGGDPAALFLALVERMRDLSAEADAELLVVLTFPAGFRPDGPVERELVVLDGLQAAGIATLNTLGLFEYREGADDDDYAPDGHWSPSGHARLAEALLSELRSRGWL